MQKITYDWQKEASLAGTHLFYLNLASELVDRETTAPASTPVTPPSHNGETPTQDERTMRTSSGHDQEHSPTPSRFHTPRAYAPCGEKPSCVTTASDTTPTYSVWGTGLATLNTPSRYSPVSTDDQTVSHGAPRVVPPAPSSMVLMDNRWLPPASYRAHDQPSG